MLTIGICDDEESVRIYIRSLIGKQDIGCRIAEFASGQELLQYPEGELQIDILFLDIELKDVDGMTVARQFRERTRSRHEAVWGSLPLLIFVTGYPQYMPEAFSVNAFQFIMKPVGERQFSDVFAQAVREYGYLMEQKRPSVKEILVRSGSRKRRIPTDDIYYIESSSRKVILSLGQEKIEYYGKIGELEKELGHHFFRIHRGYLVNMKYVEQYDRTQVRMKNGDELLISKYKHQDFARAYLDYASEEG